MGDRFSRIGEHFTPVVSTEAVCVIANPTHTDDLIMSDTGGAGGIYRNDAVTTRVSYVYSGHS